MDGKAARLLTVQRFGREDNDRGHRKQQLTDTERLLLLQDLLLPGDSFRKLYDGNDTYNR